MTLEINTESALTGMEWVAAFCIGAGLLLGFLQGVVFEYPSRLGVWLMLVGILTLIAVIALDHML